MLRGIYSSAAGMIMEMDKVAMHAGNISNAQTAGFKRREMSSIPFKELLINIVNEKGEKPLTLPVGTGSGASFMSIDSTQGSLKPTGNEFDLGISGNGYFAIQKRNTNEEVLTRNGRFIIDEQGYIINPDGDYLINDKNQRMKLDLPNSVTGANDKNAKPLGSRFVVSENGKVSDNGTDLGRLKIYTDSNQLDYISQLKLAAPLPQVATYGNNGNSILDATGKEIRIKQGFLEGSNIQIISEMVGLIHASKNYESGHKLIMAEDKILDKAINELGRTG